MALSFDSDHETSDLRDGGGSVARLSWGQYGARVGVPRIAALLAKHDVRATFFVPAVTALIHPDEQRALVAAGHEIGLHGWIHEMNTSVPPEDERDLIFRAADTLEAITGQRGPWACARHPGISAPSPSPSSANLVSPTTSPALMADEDCYELLDNGEPTGIVELPVEWIRDDAPYLAMNRGSWQRPYMPPAGVFDIWRRELDAAFDDGGIFQLTCHPHIIGYRSRVWILDELIRHARSRGAVWFATHAEVAVWARDHAD